MDIALLMEAYGDDAAVALVWSVAETLTIANDIRTGAEVPHDRLGVLLMNSLAALPSNTFYCKHLPRLAPMLHHTVVRFQSGADLNPIHAVAEFACFVAFLCGGVEHARIFAPRIREMIYAN